jgi:hypothetical protein
MKAIIIILVFLMQGLHLVHAQTIVRDKYKIRQMESMVVTRWGKFIPKWNYVLFHNKYRKGEDRRTILQLAPTIISTEITRTQSEEAEEDGQQWMAQASWKELNILMEAPYALHYKKNLAELNAEINLYLQQLLLLQADPETVEEVKSEQSRINDHVRILREGRLTPVELGEALAGTVHELRALRNRLTRYISFLQISNKYHKP